ncbi:DEAD/DEAH box helicase [Nicoliella spurrieriana]|uniref:ATP-dependent RNA helicase CshA n=1 Tax=Nicoliella spurrieriana TaxID=2925830 RepID=A0A976RSP5_9LACO|nr:DEAD/DEAH box helicase [Nicoliella spurrieriana]UQS87055.1 DEAD/DEAH box helicase [Nicoliella spurrieriana]
MKFRDLGLSDDLLTAVEKAGFTEATPIQADTIPLILEGHDVLGQAQTGTGKTAAFSLPILDKIDLDDPNVQALVVSPTRELAIQTQREMNRFGRVEGAKVQAIYGGADIRQQIRNLKKHPQVIVGTPGRILDHINRRTLKLGNVKFLVLDEADDMLDMGFLDDIESILKALPTERQTLLFSATMPDKIKRVGVQFMNNPKQVKIKAKELTTDLVDQYYVRSKEAEKFDLMTRFFDVQAPKVTIVFCRTKRRVDEVSRGLITCGYPAAGLHGDLTQKRRSQIMREFRDGKITILVATDVAARGIDVSGVTHVYNYDIPQDPESYVHRIGRTGRAGNHGVSLTFVEPNEKDYLREVEKLTKVRMLPLKPPSETEALNGQLAVVKNELGALIQKTDMDKFSDTADELLEKYSAKELVSVLLSKMTRSQVKVRITPERPLPNKKRRFSRGRRYNGHSGGRGGHSNGGRRYNGRNNNHRNDRRSGDRRNNHRSNGGGKSFTIKQRD